MAFLHKTTKNNPQNDRNHTYFISHRHDFTTQTRKKKAFLSKDLIFNLIKKEHEETNKAKADFYVVKHIKQYVNF